MFTGLIECKGVVSGTERKGASIRLIVAPEPDDFEVQVGDSVAVDGVCLTVTGLKVRAFTVDVSSESIRRSTLGEIKRGGAVNLERALRLGDRVGGHMVQGHVDATGSIMESRTEGEFRKLKVSAPPEVMRYVIEKGSIAMDGISLTVNTRSESDFTLMLIPETLKRTTLADKRRGDRVNLEADVIAKYVERLLFDKKGSKDNITLDKLKEEGFI